MNTRVISDIGDYLSCLITEIATVDIDEGELPFDTECRACRAREIDPNRR